ncbi:conserved hypothetical protein [Vibrio coralliirubri]|nr:conserved hypothetical protein [Vibrio coralliirubri]
MTRLKRARPSRLQVTLAAKLAHHCTLRFAETAKLRIQRVGWFDKEQIRDASNRDSKSLKADAGFESLRCEELKSRCGIRVTEIRRA